MFAKIANFFIKNGKLTFVLILITLISGVGAYFVLPKQYNPTIIVPAFNVTIGAPSLDSKEVRRLIVEPLEDKIMELEGIDEVYGLAGENFGGVMVKFKVGTDKEKAKIRITQKIRENMNLKPLGISEPVIKTIDPDELPQITFAISYKETKNDKLSEEKKYIYLRQIANIIKKDIRTIKNVTTIDIVGGEKKDLIIELDIEKIEAKNVDIMQVYDILKKNNFSLPAGDINSNYGEKTYIHIDGKISNINKLNKLIIGKFQEKIIFLEDIANIKYGSIRINKTSTFTKIEKTKNPKAQETVFLGVGKAIGTNAVFVTKDVIKKINEIKEKLPKNIEITIIQNEGKTAENATNMLLVNLFQSVIIVFIILAFYLGIKNAFNTSISIPLTLGLVFLLAYIFGENINKITLFALILVLGMLVDNSTVVVENISRHLKDRRKTGKTKLEAVLEGVQEVGTGVILATITRLLAFASMFAVTGMMGEYMGPIPKFAIRALLISLVIAFTINPWISYISAKEISENTKKEKSDESPLKIRKKYLALMKIFLNNTKSGKLKRKIFRYTFWIMFFIIIFGPIYAGIFKARMLPKSNQEQIYLWIDTPKNWTTNKVKELNSDINKFFLNPNLSIKTIKEQEKIDTSLDGVVKSVSLTTGQSFMGDFANLFRGGSNRVGENELSARINLVSNEDYKEKYFVDRLNSEQYTIKIRPYLKNFLLTKYPDLKIRLLEDPPGPPVKATFLVKIKSDGNEENIDIFREKVEKEIRKISKKEKLVDIFNSNSNPKRKINVKLDNELISRAGLTTEQIAYTLRISINSIQINLLKDENSFEATNIILTSKQNNNLDILRKITFTNKTGEKISLGSIAKLEYSFVSNDINTDGREKTTYIYGEMGENSLIYPVIKLFGIFKSEEFLGKNYKLISWNPYSLEYIGIKDGKKYIIEWGGEWELTMDTFRDLGIAMFLSLLFIYFLLVGQFSSFKISGIVMITFLLGFFGVFPGFTILYLLNNEYFSATSMIGIIALAGIVVGNAIILIDYINVLKKNGLTLEKALLKAGYVRFAPIILTSLTTVFGAATIVGDPVWSGLAWAIIWGLSVSSILTLIVIPIFYYESQKDNWDKDMIKK